MIRFRSVSVPRISLPCPCSSPERTTSVANRLCEGPGSGELPAGSQSLVQLPWVVGVRQISRAQSVSADNAWFV